MANLISLFTGNADNLLYPLGGLTNMFFGLLAGIAVALNRSWSGWGRFALLLQGVIGMKLIGAGRYGSDSDRIDNAIKFVTGLGSVDMMVVGFEHKEQIDNYLARVENVLTNRG